MRILVIIFVVLVACAFVLVVNARWVDSQTRPAKARDGGQILEAINIRANVRVEGRGQPIVLIHGFGAAMNWWDEITPELANGHRVIRMDLIGHGGTEAPAAGYSIEKQAELVSAILNKLGLDRITIVGHSMGGEVATALAEIRPDRIERMILIDSPPTAGTTFTLATEAYLQPFLGEFLSNFRSDRIICRGLAQGFAPGFSIPEKFIADFKRLTYTAFRSAHEESIAYRKSKAPYERIAALQPVPPLLAVFGTQDAIVPPAHAKLFERVRGASVAMIEGVGHSPMVESPVKVLALIKAFLQPES
ncbi:MAG TPA: alpha/beta fold hydrolase [Candidatus Udaeobacter sp.]|jgi:pimeloyl-ACP methyl ester carboxylesterase|nr:alpha/beta fold hydrolase [Candidatus Udaeobacter sp.]